MQLEAMMWMHCIFRWEAEQSIIKYDCHSNRCKMIEYNILCRSCQYLVLSKGPFTFYSLVMRFRKQQLSHFYTGSLYIHCFISAAVESKVQMKAIEAPIAKILFTIFIAYYKNTLIHPSAWGSMYLSLYTTLSLWTPWLGSPFFFSLWHKGCEN